MEKLRPPSMTTQMRADATAASAQARRDRAQIRNRLKYGQGSLAEAIEEGQRVDSIGKMKVSALLESMPGVGRVRALQIMEEVGIMPNRRIRGLGKAQARALIAHFQQR